MLLTEFIYLGDKIYPVDPVNPVKRRFLTFLGYILEKLILMKECAKCGIYALHL